MFKVFSNIISHYFQTEQYPHLCFHYCSLLASVPSCHRHVSIDLGNTIFQHRMKPVLLMSIKVSRATHTHYLFLLLTFCVFISFITSHPLVQKFPLRFKFTSSYCQMFPNDRPRVCMLMDVSNPMICDGKEENTKNAKYKRWQVGQADFYRH